MKILLTGFVFFALTFTMSCNLATESEGKASISIESIHNILDLKGIPVGANDRSISVQSDLGAWHGYSLGNCSKPGFGGPYLLTEQNGIWLSSSLLQMITDRDSLHVTNCFSIPGRLVKEFSIGTINVVEELIFISNRTAMIKHSLTNTSKLEQKIWPEWIVSLFDDAVLEGEDNLLIKTKSQKTTGLISASFEKIIVQFNDSASLKAKNELVIGPGQEVILYHSETFVFDTDEMSNQLGIIESAMLDPEGQFRLNAERWQGYFNRLTAENQETYTDPGKLVVLAKCLQTLITNWRGPAGELRNNGLFPSYHYRGFHGFWAWDSWKHAVALAQFDGALAQDQIRAMYDFQNDEGMIPDCVFRDTVFENHNWRDTKPPLSGWAVWEVYEKIADLAFLTEMYPKVKRYHSWWFAHRDHDQNGLCEYGSTDGTLVAAKWESGMDNARRFDSAKILMNHPGAWSMDQESVDLNAYLWLEKQLLARMADELQKPDEAQQFLYESEKLLQLILSTFYDQDDGWFYDVNLKNREKIKVQGPEGWIPLWVGLVPNDIASRIVQTMLDSSKFYTFVPFPTLVADRPELSPSEGYWRGPVWLDQVYFAIEALKSYGYDQEADESLTRIMTRLEGLGNPASSIRENYNPLTGKGLNAHHFSWSAGHLLLLLTDFD